MNAQLGAGGAAGVNLGGSVGGSGWWWGLGNVSVTTSGGLIKTEGDQSAGILAQSIGGGGGTGGGSFSMQGSIGGTAGVNASAAIGGTGGGGGSAGSVTVNSGSSILTGFLSYGIFAQSLGGGVVAAYNQWKYRPWRHYGVNAVSSAAVAAEVVMTSP